MSEKAAECRVFDVRRNICVDAETEESEHTFYVIESSDWCNIIPITKNGEVVLIEQFRQGVEQVTLEIPGGMIDEGETPQEAAVRELLEETGFAPTGEVISLGKAFPNPAIHNNTVHFFAALDCEEKQAQSFDATEECIVKLVPLSEINNLIETEQITHSLVLAGFLRYQLHQNKNK